MHMHRSSYTHTIEGLIIASSNAYEFISCLIIILKSQIKNIRFLSMMIEKPMSSYVFDLRLLVLQHYDRLLGEAASFDVESWDIVLQRHR